MKKIDTLINELQLYNTGFLYIQYYPHTNCNMYKIDIDGCNTEYKQHTIVFSPVSEGIEKSLVEAIEYFKKKFKGIIK